MRRTSIDRASVGRAEGEACRREFGQSAQQWPALVAPGDIADVLLRRAEEALDSAKRTGGRRYVVGTD